MERICVNSDVLQRGRGKSVEQALQAYPHRFARVDATEQSVRRWKEEKTQGEHYSGKPVLATGQGRKIIPVRSQLVVNEHGETRHCPGGIAS